MNPKIKKVIDDIERTKAKIVELQALLPELERKRIDMENSEIIKLVRSADILPAELPALLESLKISDDYANSSLVHQGANPSLITEALDSADETEIDNDLHNNDKDDSVV